METKASRIQAFVDAFRPVEELLPIDEALLDFRPFEDAWTIRENILHLLDADINGIVRLRKAFAQKGTPIVTYDEEAWTKNLSYGAFDVQPVIAVTRALRELTATLLRTKIEEDWSVFAFSHPDLGLVSVDQWLTTYTKHVEFHRALIDRNIQAFRAR